ncbi:MAG: hypothetical protein A3B86_01820 [Candidatus Yanofskybacteria bacterium RIFCSPHIGHO2_02_FULL_38_22b]|uniref:Uncharacterized protein n=1 Tax=Candidatus Yanofskybacteria bacterium RIFCSPHIGHO2_02_FULL_38_22b TaxID=1802673 RepID=A0A1F8F1V9_9BACT|nr:MAG: hypothetical protein A2816_00720 [Candidatus Yanofskybacteria bacterium RIFCSPHIGHO2_01_FULL_39_44]OGN07127.1 MAG: hypothetical protein A3B86_01820 [Candidatus Yanofskybacteria bacterium RIFCSPHIGHO2_02_FULL_38_22b]OGN19977.1 MAG: hypothetical protein A2910_00530 [Candidatus Yanofskybacteria bacterium RIFCSPLOWO2_01_FULL_39_28]
MSKEIPTHKSETPYDVKTLSAQSKIRYILEIFDAGKGTTEERDKRKEKFLDLLRTYYGRAVSAKAKRQMDFSPEYRSRKQKNKIKEEQTSDEDKARIHNQIMEILTNLSTSQGLTQGQMKVVDYLVRNREEVAKMIEDYFSGFNSSSLQEYSPLKQALRGEGYFTGKKEEE